MKRIRKSRSARILTWIVTVTMIAPIFFGIVAPVSAHAQTPSGAVGNVQVVVVLDFQNRSGVGGNFLAGLAADEVRVSLSNSDRYQLIKRDEVVRAANQLGLKPPYDNVAISRLSTELGANTIVDGTIENVTEDTKHGPRQVAVTLLVRVRDAATGDLISGAAQVGTAMSRPGQTDRDSLFQEAASNAAVMAVKQILAYNLPEGTVIGTVGQMNILVLINRGSRDGVKEGMEMLVIRDRQRVGKLQVSAVFPTDSECKITDNTLGIRPEDKVRAVFPMPIVDVHTGYIRNRDTRHGNSAKTIGQILVVLLVGLVIASAATGGTGTVTGVVAEADIQNSAPAVQLVWRDTIFGSGQTLEYHIWRQPDFSFNFTGNPIAAVPAGTRNYTDFVRPFTFWDGVRSFLQVGVPTGGGGGGGNQTGTQATSTTPAATVISGFTRTGDTNIYQVTAVIRRPLPVSNSGGGGGGGNQGGGTEDIESGTVNSGPSTPLDQPVLSTPVDTKGGLDGNSLQFNWANPIGADTFQLEISTDPSFKNRNLIKIIGVSIPANAVTVTDLVAFLDNVLKNDPTWLAFRAGTSTLSNRIFWRIGARKDLDRPGPKDWITRRHDNPDRTFRFIYSNVRSFTLAPLPPNPPGKGTAAKKK